MRSIGQLVCKVSAIKRKNESFGCHDLDLNPVTLELNLHLDIVVTSTYITNMRSIGSKVMS